MKGPLSLPNLFTYFRLAAVPAVVACFFWGGAFSANDHTARWTALVIFAIAGITDYFDGWAARRLNKTTSLGVMLDPIADKLLVSACLLLLAADGTIAGWSLWAAIIILCREILVSGLREFLGHVQVTVPVSHLAKWKTTAQLVAIGFLLAGPAGNRVFPYTVEIGIVLLWLSALLTLYTGWDYFKAGVTTVVDSDR
jgi:cardiolipin synthase